MCTSVRTTAYRRMGYENHILLTGVKAEVAAPAAILTSQLHEMSAPGRRPRIANCCTYATEQLAVDAVSSAAALVLFLSPSVWSDANVVAMAAAAHAAGKPVVLVMVSRVQQPACMCSKPLPVVIVIVRLVLCCLATHMRMQTPGACAASPCLTPS